jgi:hypothetical protein
MLDNKQEAHNEAKLEELRILPNKEIIPPNQQISPEERLANLKMMYEETADVKQESEDSEFGEFGEFVETPSTKFA